MFLYKTMNKRPNYDYILTNISFHADWVMIGKS